MEKDPLGEKQVPSLAECNLPGELETVEIDATEFEAVWARRSSSPVVLGGKRS